MRLLNLTTNYFDWMEEAQLPIMKELSFGMYLIRKSGEDNVPRVGKAGITKRQILYEIIF
ncbi:MAG: hypothetical protein QM654_07270 [Dysgonamonadaceae bacterium]